MKNIILKSILLTGVISHSHTQTQYQPQHGGYENFQTQASPRKLRLNEIKAKLNRLKSKRSNNSSRRSQFSSQSSINSRDTRPQYKNQQDFHGTQTQTPNRPVQDNLEQRFNSQAQHQSLQSRSSASSHRPIQQQSNTRDSRRAFSKRSSNPQGSYDTSLVRSCENAGKDLTLRGNQGEKARNFYADRCEQLISRISIQHNLDSLLDLQGKYLSLQGRHQEANRFITLAYQQAPNELNTNIALIKNLVSLGQASMAEEMLLFYVGEKGVQNLNPREHESLKKLHQQLKQMQ